MSKKGWIRLERKIEDHWLWTDKPFSKGQAWIDLLLMANHESKSFLAGNRKIDVVPGEIITSELKLMNSWGWGKSKVRAFLSLLEQDNMIMRKTNHKQTTINIVNWGNYQFSQTSNRTTEIPVLDHYQTSDELLSNQCQTSNVPVSDTNNNITTNNNYKQLYNNYKQDVVGEAPSSSLSQIDAVIDVWNASLNTNKINGIIPMTKRWNDLQLCLSMFGLEGVLAAIQKISESQWIAVRGNKASFDNFMNPDAIQKALEGNYDKPYQQTNRVIERWTEDGLELGS